MCFSPEADALVGTIVAGVGIDALRHVHRSAQIPLAAVPLVLGLHQLTEAFVWWGLQDHVSHTIGRVALWTYLVVALAVMPIIVPASVGLVERSTVRRRLIAAFTVLSTAVALVLFVALLRGTLHAVIGGRHISYDVDGLHYGGQLTALYVLTTGGALLASGSRDLNALGVLNLAVVPVLMWMTVNGFVSLWCFWAAIASGFIAWHLRKPSVPLRLVG